MTRGTGRGGEAALADTARRQRRRVKAAKAKATVKWKRWMGLKKGSSLPTDLAVGG